MTATHMSQRPRPAARSRRLGLVAFGIILLLATLALPFWSAASTVRSDSDVTIATGETVTDDLFVMSESFVLDGEAERDVFAMARTIDIRGSVGGSLNAVGQEIDVSGPVAGSVRVVTGNVSITSDIGGDLLVLGGTVTVAEGAVIAGDAHAYGGTLEIQGIVEGDVSGSMSDLDVNGAVQGNVSIDVEDLALGAESEIGGDLSYVSPSRGEIAGGARIDGIRDHRTIAPWGVDESFRGRFFSPLVRTVWLLVTGALIIAIAPRVVSATNANLRHPIAAGIAGVVGLLMIPIAALILAITVIGLPMSMILLVGYLVAIYLSQFIVGQRIGTLLLPHAWNDGSRGYLLLTMTIGVLLLSVPRFLPVPYIDTIVSWLVVVFGLGAVALLFRQVRPWYTATSPDAR